MDMITRRELEGMGIVMTDEQWKEFNNDMVRYKIKYGMKNTLWTNKK